MRGKNPETTENHPEDIYVFKAGRKHNEAYSVSQLAPPQTTSIDLFP